MRQVANRSIARVQKVYARGLGAVVRNSRTAKKLDELTFWKIVRSKEGDLSNRSFVTYYTDHFGVDLSFYQGKRILDLGCGPRGSLEWADMAAERVGLDPLVNDYRRLGIDRHKMTYVSAPAEDIPFATGHFDIVTSFNSLDHVDDLDAVLSEIGRVTKPGGALLLITEVNHAPTISEPQSFSWGITDRLESEWELRRERRFERLDSGIYQSIDAAQPYRSEDPTPRPGLLSAMLVRRASTPT